jgi:hypothetical protein
LNEKQQTHNQQISWKNAKDALSMGRESIFCAMIKARESAGPGALARRGGADGVFAIFSA